MRDTRPANFYPRPPRGGRRPQTARCFPENRFLSTPSARRATAHVARQPLQLGISIHALREEGDSVACSHLMITPEFLSTPSARRATKANSKAYDNDKISIHALREEGDRLKYQTVRFERYFYPRPPRGGRQRAINQLVKLSIFLSTPSARRATKNCRCPRCRRSYFYPRPPRGGRRCSTRVF